MNLFNKRLFLVRHGETEYNVAHIIQGHIASPLTELGLQQAKVVGQKVKDSNIDMIVTSDLKRAIQTSEIIGKEIGLKVFKKDPIFRERDWGDFEGKHRDEIKKEYSEYVTEDGQLILEHDFPTCEPLKEFYERIINAIKSLIDEFEGKSILLVGHKGVLNIVYAYANDIPLDRIRFEYDATNCIIENY